jgi:hypothetical protein
VDSWLRGVCELRDGDSADARETFKIDRGREDDEDAIGGWSESVLPSVLPLEVDECAIMQAQIHLQWQPSQQ